MLRNHGTPSWWFQNFLFFVHSAETEMEDMETKMHILQATKSTCNCEDLYEENPHPTVNYFLKRICTAAPLLATWFHSFAADINFKVYHCRIMIMRKSWEAATTTAFHLTIWPCCAWVILWLSLAGKRPFYFELLRQQLQSTLAWFVKLCLETTEDVAGPQTARD